MTHQKTTEGLRALLSEALELADELNLPWAAVHVSTAMDALAEAAEAPEAEIAELDPGS